MGDLHERIAGLSPEKRELLLRRLRDKGKDLPKAQIPRLGRESNEFPLSFAQERLWFLDQWAPGIAAYNVPWAARIGGPSCMRCCNRHPSWSRRLRRPCLQR